MNAKGSKVTVTAINAEVKLEECEGTVVKELKASVDVRYFVASEGKTVLARFAKSESGRYSEPVAISMKVEG